jgi:hypothetical protein
MFPAAENSEAKVSLLDQQASSRRVSVVVRGECNVVARTYLLVDGPGMAHMELVDAETPDSDDQLAFDGHGHKSVLQAKLTKLALQIGYAGRFEDGVENLIVCTNMQAVLLPHSPYSF